jgi:hypothetical protein
MGSWRRGVRDIASLTKAQTVSKLNFSKMRSNKINGLKSQQAPKTGF